MAAEGATVALQLQPASHLNVQAAATATYTTLAAINMNKSHLKNQLW